MSMTHPAAQRRPRPVVAAAPEPEPLILTPEPLASNSVSLQPAQLDLSLYAGDTLTMKFTFHDTNNQPVDMTGTWAAQVRQNANDPDPPLASFTVDTTQAATGIITVTLPATASRSLNTGIPLQWDLQQTTGGTVVRTTHRGSITVTGDVTRP